MQASEGVPVLPYWEGFATKKSGGIVYFAGYRNYETRNESTFRLIRASVAEFGVPHFD
jgi:hypothetical protein